MNNLEQTEDNKKRELVIVNPQVWEAFHKESMKWIEKLKGHKVKFSKKHRT